MNLVLRPANADFLRYVLLPVFELGLADAGAGLARLTEALSPQSPVSALVDALLERGVEGSFFGLEDRDWLDAVHGLLFQLWTRGEDGWTYQPTADGYGGTLEEILHAALLMEDASYPYEAPERAGASREQAQREFTRRGLVALVTGAWERSPGFPPDQILATVGRGYFVPERNEVAADWAFRDADELRRWNAQLPGQLEALLNREQKRLGSVELVERKPLYQFWMGHRRDAPAWTVAFSGLGADTPDWVRNIGGLAGLIRKAAAAGQGLTAFVSV